MIITIEMMLGVIGIAAWVIACYGFFKFIYNEQVKRDKMLNSKQN